jgi:hypothetical protein
MAMARRSRSSLSRIVLSAVLRSRLSDTMPSHADFRLATADDAPSMTSATSASESASGNSASGLATAKAAESTQPTATPSFPPFPPELPGRLGSE